MSIKISSTIKHFSSLGGLILLKNLMAKSQLKTLIEPNLPSLKLANYRSFSKFKNMVTGFIAGAECLTDMDQLADDLGFEVNTDGLYTSKTYGNFLRMFSGENCKNLAKNLTPFSYSLREKLFPEKDSITIDIDSTSNQQYGKKMQGVTTNYKGFESLDTIKAFDEFGFQYWCDVRPGNTFTANGAGEIIHRIFSQIPAKNSSGPIKRYVRGDSGYCNSEFFNACSAKNAGFVTAMRANLYKPLLHKIKYWRNVKQNGKKGIRFYDGRTCDVGTFIYQKDRNHQKLRVLILRAIKPKDPNIIFRHDEYDYYGFITNIGEHEMSDEKLIQFYRKRGMAENFIKELKYGFDLKHYPCLKLLANKAYGLIAAYAYNLMRFIALTVSTNKISNAKKIRNTFIYLPSQIVRHAKEVVIKYSYNHYKEVNRLLNYIKNLRFGYG